MEGRARYRLERPLGRGGMGAVYLTHDSLLDRSVALKRAQRDESLDLLRFKREFRAIERLAHPNLVRLYELGSDDDGLYYTMEAIEGEDLASYCRSGDCAARLAGVLPQLLDALAFLHANGVVHCDLKPSNILVTPAGALKLLDFGVLAELSHGAHDRTVAGTPAYLAPERIRGEPATPRTDLYALGCTLFEIFTGRPPFVGSVTSVLAAHIAEPAPHAGELGATIPPELDALTRALMAKDPADRPPLDQLRAGAGRASTRSEVELVGRDTLTRRIAARLEEGARPLVLSGPSGVGKSTLLEWLAREAQRSGAIPFRSASRSTERLAYNALDAAMDDLARALHSRDRSGERPRREVAVPEAVSPRSDPGVRRAQRIAAEAFPLLRPSAQSVDGARELVRERLFGFREAPEACTRREVFDAIAALFDAVTAERGGLLVVDDFQWADADSVALMSHLLERAAPSLRVVLVLRSDVEPSLAHEWLEAVGAEVVEVPPLAERDAMAVVRRAAAELGAELDGELDQDTLRAAARTCEGRPFLAEVAGRALARGAPATLDEQLSDAWQREGELLSFLVTDDGWTPTSMLASLLGRSLGSLDEPLRQLEQRGLVRRAGGPLDGRADLYHDGVRRAALARLGADERAVLHGRMADALLGARDAPAARLVHHLASAGRAIEAAQHARRAATQAERQRAFSAAADMYAIVLESEAGDRAAREARAWALERSSRYAEAAKEWATLSEAASSSARLDLALHEAHALIAASRTAEGVRRLDAALAASGQGPVRVRGLRAAATVGRFLIGPRRRARAASSDPAARTRAERHLKIGILLAFLDPVTGMSFLQRARADFLRAGADAQVAGCDLTFAILAFAGSRDPDRVRLAERYLSEARARTRGAALPPEVRGMDPFVEGLRRMRQGRWANARALFESAMEIFRESTGTTELTMARSWLMMMAAHMQDMREVRRHRDWFRRHAADCGGTLLVLHLGLVDGYVQMLEGRFDDAHDTLTRAADLFDDDPPNAQRAALRLYRYGADIYRDDGRRARRELAVERERARPFRFMSTMYAGTYGVIPALIEANALRSGDREASSRRIDRLSAIIESAPPLWAGGSWRARAYAADAEGRPEDALLHLARAEEEAARFDRHVDAAIARWQRGRRLGGDYGAELCASAEELVRSLEVSPLLLEEDAGLR